MRCIALITTIILVTGIAGGCAISIEEAKYEVVSKDENFEIRDYAPHVVAETVVEGTLENAGNTAFYRLFEYISGKNQTRDKIVMTAPVSQEPVTEKINMTVPVGQQRFERGWLVSFTMPASYNLEALPEPADTTVKLRRVLACRMAVVRYSGGWSEKRYLRYKKKLESWINKKEFRSLGEPIWARYNPPFTPWFLRRNEILIPVSTDTKWEDG